MHVYLNQVHVFRTYLHVVHVNGSKTALARNLNDDWPSSLAYVECTCTCMVKVEME